MAIGCGINEWRMGRVRTSDLTRPLVIARPPVIHKGRLAIYGKKKTRQGVAVGFRKTERSRWSGVRARRGRPAFTSPPRYPVSLPISKALPMPDRVPARILSTHIPPSAAPADVRCAARSRPFPVRGVAGSTSFAKRSEWHVPIPRTALRAARRGER